MLKSGKHFAGPFLCYPYPCPYFLHTCAQMQEKPVLLCEVELLPEDEDDTPQVRGTGHAVVPDGDGRGV
jgi:hypothetical protein